MSKTSNFLQRTKHFSVRKTRFNVTPVSTESSPDNQHTESSSPLEPRPCDNCSTLSKPGAKSSGLKDHLQDRRKDYQKKLKTEICKVYQLGFDCPYGDRCSFAHGARELKHKGFVSERYKTIRCTQFHKKSYCQYGPRCQFIHRQGKKNGVKKMKPKYQQILDCMQNCCEALEITKREELFPNLINESFMDIFRVPKLSIFESLRT